jgi:hypothetical protein
MPTPDESFQTLPGAKKNSLVHQRTSGKKASGFWMHLTQISHNSKAGELRSMKLEKRKKKA